MDISEAQAIVDEWIRTTGGGYFSELTNMAVLTEEAGELARVIARVYGDQRPKASDLPEGCTATELPAMRRAMKSRLSEELADMLWVVICLANQTGTDLTEALRASLDKKTRRDAERFK